MASASVVTIDPAHRPVFGVPEFATGSPEMLAKTMQENHEKHHIFFNARGFHNHIAHHLVTAYALGATPEQLEHHYAHNAQYQRDPIEMNKLVSGMDDVARLDNFMAYLGNESLYQSYITLFASEISKKGYRAVLDEYVFAGDARSKAMYNRLSAGILHPFIHLGLAIEFDVPAMVAEALAWTAVHSDAEAVAIDAWEAREKADPTDPHANLVDLYREIQRWAPEAREASGANKKLLAVGDGALADIISRYRITEDNLEARVAEAQVVHAFVMLAGQHRPHVPKMDFSTMHSNNASVYLPAFARALSRKQAVALVELQVRSSLWEYARTGAPAFDIDYTNQFVAHPDWQPAGTVYRSWEQIFAKVVALDDDGHVGKAIRGVKAAEQACGTQTTFAEPLKRDEFLGLAGVLMRSCEQEPDFVASRGKTAQWIHGAGSEDAWAEFPKVQQVMVS